MEGLDEDHANWALPTNVPERERDRESERECVCVLPQQGEDW